MAAYCGKGMELFIRTHRVVADTCSTVQEIVFPYGNKYAWAKLPIERRRKAGICNVFAENGAFTVMIRLSNAQFLLLVYDQVGERNLGMYRQQIPLW